MQYWTIEGLLGRHIIYSFIPGPIGYEFGGSIDDIGDSKSFGLGNGQEKNSYHYKTHYWCGDRNSMDDDRRMA